MIMAKAKTSVFTLTHEMDIPTAVGTTAIPIGSLIDVADAQALEIVSVDYVFQGYDTSNDVYLPSPDVLSSSPAGVTVQLTDRNTAKLISAADNNLISSGFLGISGGGDIDNQSDIFPDDFKGDTGRFVVNDELYLTADNSTSYDANRIMKVTVRIRAKVVKLSTRDWMAISLETVQNE